MSNVSNGLAIRTNMYHRSRRCSHVAHRQSLSIHVHVHYPQAWCTYTDRVEHIRRGHCATERQIVTASSLQGATRHEAHLLIAIVRRPRQQANKTTRKTGRILCPPSVQFYVLQLAWIRYGIINCATWRGEARGGGWVSVALEWWRRLTRPVLVAAGWGRGGRASVPLLQIWWCNLGIAITHS